MFTAGRVIHCYFCKARERYMVPFYRLDGEDLYSCQICAKSYRNKWVPEKDGSLSLFIKLKNKPVDVTKL